MADGSPDSCSSRTGLGVLVDRTPPNDYGSNHRCPRAVDTVTDGTVYHHSCTHQSTAVGDAVSPDRNCSRSACLHSKLALDLGLVSNFFVVPVAAVAGSLVSVDFDRDFGNIAPCTLVDCGRPTAVSTVPVVVARSHPLVLVDPPDVAGHGPSSKRPTVHRVVSGRCRVSAVAVMHVSQPNGIRPPLHRGSRRATGVSGCSGSAGNTPDSIPEYHSVAHTALPVFGNARNRTGHLFYLYLMTALQRWAFVSIN